MTFPCRGWGRLAPSIKPSMNAEGQSMSMVSILAWLEEDGAGHPSHREAQGCSFAQVCYVLAKANQCGSAYVFHIANLYDSRYCGAFDRARKIPLGPREVQLCPWDRKG